MVCGDLAAGAEDADDAEDQGEDPPGGAVEAVAAADDDGEDESGKVDDQLDYRDVASGCPAHCEVGMSMRKFFVSEGALQQWLIWTGGLWKNVGWKRQDRD